MRHIHNAYLNLIRSGSFPRDLESSAPSGLIHRVLDTLTELIEKGACHIRRWRDHRAAVAALNALDDHLLRDIGLNRGDVLTFSRGGMSIDNLNRLRTGEIRFTSRFGTPPHVGALPHTATYARHSSKPDVSSREGRLDSAA